MQPLGAQSTGYCPSMVNGCTVQAQVETLFLQNPDVPRERQLQHPISSIEREALTGGDKLAAAVMGPLLKSIENIHQ